MSMKMNTDDELYGLKVETDEGARNAAVLMSLLTTTSHPIDVDRARKFIYLDGFWDAAGALEHAATAIEISSRTLEAVHYDSEEVYPYDRFEPESISIKDEHELGQIQREVTERIGADNPINLPPDGRWRCLGCGRFLHDLSDLDQVTRLVHKFIETGWYACPGRREKNYFTIEQSGIISPKIIARTAS